MSKKSKIYKNLFTFKENKSIKPRKNYSQEDLLISQYIRKKKNSNIVKKKPNNVTNNICIIIKTSNDKEKENYSIGYNEIFKNLRNIKYPMSPGNNQNKKLKQSNIYFKPYKRKIFTSNNSSNRNINTGKNSQEGKSSTANITNKSETGSKIKYIYSKKNKSGIKYNTLLSDVSKNKKKVFIPRYLKKHKILNLNSNLSNDLDISSKSDRKRKKFKRKILDSSLKYIDLKKNELFFNKHNSFIIKKENPIYLNYKRDANNIKNNNTLTNKSSLENVRYYSSNPSLICNKSYKDYFIKEKKMKKNIDMIVDDIKKMLRRNKPRFNETFNAPKTKRRNSIFSQPKKEVVMIKNSDDGRTLRCIKKLDKNKKRINEQGIKSNKYVKPKSVKKILEKPKKTQENKKIDINIPGKEIKVLRRIKKLFENYQKNPKSFNIF